MPTVIGAPLCVWTLAAAVAEAGSDSLYQAIAAPLETSVPPLAVVASIALTIAGVVAGGVLARSSRRAGNTDRLARAALLIGLVGFACLAIGALVILLGGFIIYGSA